ncbi:hypothetical protein [Sphingobacterium sp.]|uniref:hypothetical protein n=1 Tax=Sphingobacterium sp. TaxID=341027 RepID=UPI002FD9580D
MEINDFLKKIDVNVNLLIFLLTTLIGFISWLVKGLIESPLSFSKATFDKHFNTRVEILTEIKNRLALMLYLTNGDNNEDINKFKNEIQEILLKDGKSAYISKDILDYALNISVLPDTNINKVHHTINLIDEELYGTISKVNDELIFYRKFSNHNPIKRILGLIFITVQYLIVITIVSTLIYLFCVYFINSGLFFRAVAVTSLFFILFLIDAWLSDRYFNLKNILAYIRRKQRLAKEDDNFFRKSNFLISRKIIVFNKVKNYEKIDFSSIWNKSKDSEIFGIIGEEHQRLKIYIVDIKQNEENGREYFIFGQFQIEEKIIPFNGTITLVNIYEYEKLYFGIDDERKNSGIKKQGVLIGKYQFNQRDEDKDFGLFQGKIYSKWFIDKDNRIQYDDIERFSDKYFNNAYVGTFKTVRNPFSKQCNWGDFRVPLANEDFDIGEGDFKVADKYLDNGWR